MKPLRLIAIASILLGAPWATPAAAADTARTPVILITDIGTDIDDSWALGLALRSPELDLKLVVTDPADTVYRASVTAKFLEDAGRGDIPIGIGDNSGPNGDNFKTLTAWIKGYDISKYPGKVYQDGVSALIDAIEKSPVPVTVVGIGPVNTLAIALERAPDIATKCRFVGMYGSFDVGYAGPGKPSNETNVRVNPEGLRTVLAAHWRDVLLTPLDTCGSVSLQGERYHAIWSATSDPMLRAIITSYCVFAPVQNWMLCDYFATRSTTLFDCVAVYLAYSESLVNTETVTFDVTDDGYTRRSPTGAYKARVALSWKDRDAFEAQLADRLLAK
jgi:inosine-uridine nucleoside N-ribohydrolase